MLMGLCPRRITEGREMLQALPPSLGGMCFALLQWLIVTWEPPKGSAEASQTKGQPQGCIPSTLAIASAQYPWDWACKTFPSCTRWALGQQDKAEHTKILPVHRAGA